MVRFRCVVADETSAGGVCFVAGTSVAALQVGTTIERMKLGDAVFATTVESGATYTTAWYPLMGDDTCAAQDEDVVRPDGIVAKNDATLTSSDLELPQQATATRVWVEAFDPHRAQWRPMRLASLPAGTAYVSEGRFFRRRRSQRTPSPAPRPRARPRIANDSYRATYGRTAFAPTGTPRTTRIGLDVFNF